MSNSFGFITNEGETGSRTLLFANPTGMRPKVGGTTVDWSKVAAVSGSPVTLPDGTVIPVGKKYLRYGTILTKITQVEVNSILVTADDGTFTVSVTIWGNTATTGALAYNASASTVQAALNDLPLVADHGGVTVTKPSTSLVLTFNQLAGNVTVTTDATELDNNGDPGTAAVTATTQGSETAGWYGPYESTATDGRQNRNRGEAFFIAKTVLEDDDMSRHIPGYVGGTIYLARLDIGDAPKMTRAQFETLFPEARFVDVAN